MVRSSRRGFTLIELLVVIAIIGVLIGLLLPAVQKVRESASRMKCQNNLKQLALGMHTRHENKGSFAPGTRKNPVGAPELDHSWTLTLLPFIEQDVLYKNFVGAGLAVKSYSDASFSLPTNDPRNFRLSKMATFSCSSDLEAPINEESSTTAGRFRGSYVANWGNTNYGQTNDLSGTSYDPVYKDAPFKFSTLAKPEGVKIEDIGDGTSTTIMFSESTVINYSGGGWGGPLSDIHVSGGGQAFQVSMTPNDPRKDQVYGGPALDVGSLNTRPEPVPTGSLATQIFSARSKHIGGVNVAMCDGSVRFYSNDISPKIWIALGTANGKEAQTSE